MLHSELQCSQAMCFLVSVGSLINIDDVNKEPQEVEGLPKDDKALIFFSIESWKFCKLDRLFDGFPKFTDKLI